MFRLDNQVTIPTAEGVQIELTLAGLGSRMLAAALDLLIYAAVILALWTVSLPIFLTARFDWEYFVVAVYGAITLFGFVMYPTLLEAFWGGQTIGKRAVGLRVVTTEGYPPTLSTVFARNAVRIVDFFPGVYLTGAISILATEQGQRLGDLVAGTVVIRNPKLAYADNLPGGTPDIAVWDVSQVTQDDILAIRHFLRRAPQLSTEVRNRVANQLATSIFPRVHITTYSTSAEAFLRKVAYDKTNRS